MFSRRASLQVPATVGVFLLLFAGATEAFGVRACPHHQADAGGVAAAERDGHAPGDPTPDHPSAGPDDTSHSDGAHGCDCGFLCLGVTGPPPVHALRPSTEASTTQAPRERSMPVEETETLRPSLVPFVLPYAQPPPARI